MIEVRIRHDFEADSVHLCDWPAVDVDRIIPTLGPWGIHTDAGDYQTDDLSGQVMVADGRAFFEVIITTEAE